MICYDVSAKLLPPLFAVSGFGWDLIIAIAVSVMLR